MLISCLILLSLFYLICKELRERERISLSNFENSTMHTWHLDEAFTFVVVLMLVISMGSSSMVEEEQYIWHFVTSTLILLLLRKAIQSLEVGRASSLFSLVKGQNRTSFFQITSLVLLLISGRILRGWHQGGVNWTNLPDISKWLEQAGGEYIKAVQLVTGILVMILSLISLSALDTNKKIVKVIGFCFLTPGLLVLHHVIKHQSSILVPSSYNDTVLIQMIYMVLGFTALGTVVALPWLSSLLASKTCPYYNFHTTTSDPKLQNTSQLVELTNSLFVIGWVYICYWSLLQLVLQQPINSMPILLLLVQVLLSMRYSFYSGPHHKQWVEVSHKIILFWVDNVLFFYKTICFRPEGRSIKTYGGCVE